MARISLCVLVVAAPLLLGGVPNWAPALLLPLALWTFAFSVRGRRDVRVPMVALVPLAVAAACLAQVVPLPPPLLWLLSPTSDALRDFALTPLGLTSWRPISLDPSATFREALKWAVYAATALAAIHVTQNSRTNRQLPLQCLAIAGAVMVGLAWLHSLLEIEELFGIYRFQHATPPLLTPFGNPNHLAGFLLLCGTLSAGLLLESRSSLRRAGWAVCWAACCAGVLISNSRGGIGAFVLVHGVLVSRALWRMRKDTRGPLPNAIRLSMILALAVLAGIWLLGERLFARFSDTTSAVNKFAQWPHALELVRDCWRLGAGRGAYEVAFTRYYADHVGKTFTHPENLILQWTAEFGIPLAIAFAVGAGVALYRLWRASGGSHWEVAALLAGIGVVLHNLLDFNLEYPGVCVPLAAVLGVVAGSSEALISRRLPLWVVAGGLTVTGLLGVWHGRDSAADADRRLYDLARTPIHAAKLQELALVEIDLHPADYFLYDIVAAAWIFEREPREALAFANRALWLFPNDGGAHLVAARALRMMGKRSQALLEYRLASETVADSTEIVKESARYAKDVDELWTLSGGSLRWVRSIADQVRNVELATSLLLRARAELPVEEGVEAIVLDAVRNLVQLERLDQARKVIDEAVAVMPPSADLILARAVVEKSAGDRSAMAEALDEGLKRWPGHFGLTLERLQLLLAAKRWHEARALLARTSSGTIDPRHRLELTLFEASVDMNLGLSARALESYRSATSLAPSSRTHSALANALASLKQYDEAVAELRAAQRFETLEGAKAIETTIGTLEAARDAEQARAIGP